MFNPTGIFIGNEIRRLKMAVVNYVVWIAKAHLKGIDGRSWRKKSTESTWLESNSNLKPLYSKHHKRTQVLSLN